MSSTEHTLTVKWSRPTPGEFDQFELKLSGVPDTTKTVDKDTAPYEATFTFLLAGTRYTVEVISQSGNQNSATKTESFYTSECFVNKTLLNPMLITAWYEELFLL